MACLFQLPVVVAYRQLNFVQYSGHFLLTCDKYRNDQAIT